MHKPRVGGQHVKSKSALDGSGPPVFNMHRLNLPANAKVMGCKKMAGPTPSPMVSKSSSLIPSGLSSGRTSRMAKHTSSKHSLSSNSQGGTPQNTTIKVWSSPPSINPGKYRAKIKESTTVPKNSDLHIQYKNAFHEGDVAVSSFD